jgi:hypothetical protein
MSTTSLVRPFLASATRGRGRAGFGAKLVDFGQQLLLVEPLLQRVVHALKDADVVRQIPVGAEAAEAPGTRRTGACLIAEWAP